MPHEMTTSLPPGTTAAGAVRPTRGMQSPGAPAQADEFRRHVDGPMRRTGSEQARGAAATAEEPGASADDTGRAGVDEEADWLAGILDIPLQPVDPAPSSPEAGGTGASVPTMPALAGAGVLADGSISRALAGDPGGEAGKAVRDPLGPSAARQAHPAPATVPASLTAAGDVVAALSLPRHGTKADAQRERIAPGDPSADRSEAPALQARPPAVSPVAAPLSAAAADAARAFALRVRDPGAGGVSAGGGNAALTAGDGPVIGTAAPFDLARGQDTAPVPLAQLRDGAAQQVRALVERARTELATRRAADGSLSTELELAPAELGRLRLVLQTGERGLHLTVLVDRPESLEAVRRQLDGFHRSLLADGVTLDGVDIGTGGRDRGRAPHPNPPAGEPDGATLDIAPTTPSAAGPTRAAAGRLDIRL